MASLNFATNSWNINFNLSFSGHNDVSIGILRHSVHLVILIGTSLEDPAWSSLLRVCFMVLHVSAPWSMTWSIENWSWRIWLIEDVHSVLITASTRSRTSFGFVDDKFFGLSSLHVSSVQCEASRQDFWAKPQVIGHPLQDRSTSAMLPYGSIWFHCISECQFVKRDSGSVS